MGCFNSKNQQPSVETNNWRIKRAGDLSPVQKFVPENYEYVGLSSAKVSELMNADRDTPDRSIRDHKAWANVVYVYDGDTCHIVINYQNVLTKLKCRVNGIDTPEIRTSNPEEKAHAIRAKERFIELTQDRLVWVHVLNNDDKYGRYLVKFFIDSEEVHAIDRIMIEENYGYAYDGGTKIDFEDWYNA